MTKEISYEPFDDSDFGELFGDTGSGSDFGPWQEAEPINKTAVEVTIDPLTILFEYSKNLVPGIVIDDRGLELPDGVTFDQAANLNELFYSLNSSVPLLWGDLLNQAERAFREEFTQLLADEIGRKEGTIRNWRWVANAVPWDIRPDPKKFQFSKLYHVAGLRDVSLMKYIVDIGEFERPRTEEVRELTDLLKMYEDAGEEAHWSEVAQRHAFTFAEFTEAVREDLIIRGFLKTEDAEEEVPEEKVKAEKTADETAEDLVNKLLGLAGKTGQAEPQNRIGLFASLVKLAKALAFSDDPEFVNMVFAGMDSVADHLRLLRLAQIDAGSEEVGCICEIGEMFDIVQFTDCPIHGDPAEVSEDRFHGNESDLV